MIAVHCVCYKCFEAFLLPLNKEKKKIRFEVFVVASNGPQSI